MTDSDKFDHKDRGPKRGAIPTPKEIIDESTPFEPGRNQPTPDKPDTESDRDLPDSDKT